MKEITTTISLELLILNDLLNRRTIDKEIYDRAVDKIIAINNKANTLEEPVMLATG